MSQCDYATVCSCACRLDDDRRRGRRVDRTSSNRASSNSTSLGVDRAGRPIEIRRIKGERLGIRVAEWVVSQAGCVLGSASGHVGQILGTTSIVSRLAVSGRALRKLEFARECGSSSQHGDSCKGSEVHLDYVSMVGSVIKFAGVPEFWV